MRIKCSEYLNIITHWIQSRKQKRCIFFNAPLPPGITSGKDWFQHSKGVYSEKHNCCVKSSNKATCRSRTDMLLVLNFEKTKRVNTSDPSSTLLLYHTKIFHASRKKPLGGEQLLSGRKYSDSHSVLTLRGSVWYYYIMPLCFMQTESRRPQPRSTAHCERISEPKTPRWFWKSNELSKFTASTASFTFT